MSQEIERGGWRELERGGWLLLRSDGWRAAYARDEIANRAGYAELFDDAPFGWQRFVNVWTPGTKTSGKVLTGMARSLAIAIRRAEGKKP